MTDLPETLEPNKPTILKEIAVDQITVTENGTVLYRETTRIVENGVELAKHYHRTTLTPGQDLATVPEKVTAICAVVWTPEVLDAFASEVLAAASKPLAVPVSEVED